ncbi:MAG: PAS domain-containing protein [Alphaproteobacteria bacterium]|nr:PAS domain-containing protein [Alphaproteobacteria bacterium]
MFQKRALATGSRQVENLAITGVERHLHKDDIIVSKTDIPGTITYVNKIFIDISGYTEEEMLGRPHSVIRHPHMPRAVFKLLWDTLGAGKEIFAYVMNRCKNGDHYWVIAHVTPSYSLDGKLIGYHSSRRAPQAGALNVIKPLYEQLLKIEQNAGRKEGLEASYDALTQILAEKEISYEKFVLSL